MHAILRVNGSTEMLRTLVSNGYPVLIETWLEEDPDDGMGHYRLVTGYDDARQAWILYDSYVATNLVDAGGKDGAGDYAGIWSDYATMEAWWKVFNRTWLLVYPPEDEAVIQRLLGSKYIEDQWQGGEDRARADLAIDDTDAFAWFNLGSSLWNQGRTEEAAVAFDQARTSGLPWRMLWYQFGIFPTYIAVGRADDALALADATLASTSSIEEIHFWRGEALQALGNPDGARAAYQRALALYPEYSAAQTALAQLQ
jgi:tetratricopeptide (TPR) repeat protein